MSADTSNNDTPMQCYPRKVLFPADNQYIQINHDNQAEYAQANASLILTIKMNIDKDLANANTLNYIKSAIFDFSTFVNLDCISFEKSVSINNVVSYKTYGPNFCLIFSEFVHENQIVYLLNMVPIEEQ